MTNYERLHRATKRAESALRHSRVLYIFTEDARFKKVNRHLKQALTMLKEISEETEMAKIPLGDVNVRVE